MEKEILKQRISVLEKENKDLRLSKKVIEYTNSDLVGAIESLCTKKKQAQILNYAIKNAINRAIVLSTTNDKENETLKKTSQNINKKQAIGSLKLLIKTSKELINELKSDKEDLNKRGDCISSISIVSKNIQLFLIGEIL